MTAPGQAEKRFATADAMTSGGRDAIQKSDVLWVSVAFKMIL